MRTSNYWQFTANVRTRKEEFRIFLRSFRLAPPDVRFRSHIVTHYRSTEMKYYMNPCTEMRSVRLAGHKGDTLLIPVLCGG